MQGLRTKMVTQCELPREIDFVVNSGGKRTNIQSAYEMLTDEKTEVELKAFAYTRDSFPKIVVRKNVGMMIAES